MLQDAIDDGDNESICEDSMNAEHESENIVDNVSTDKENIPPVPESAPLPKSAPAPVPKRKRKLVKPKPKVCLMTHKIQLRTYNQRSASQLRISKRNWSYLITEPRDAMHTSDVPIISE